ncbi:MAG: sugar ABC transporter ATP-binding protein [Chloroflexi bacterium]|nr:sugar ABC transporter ATP-binding protein [Chloroflexota bacterium]
MADVPSSALFVVSGISKAFGGVKALSDVSFSADAGEIVALMGENGSGKSTLVNILAGRLQRDEGEVRLAGELVRISSPRDAHRHGIALVSQELQLVPSLSIAENLFLGDWPGNSGTVEWRTMEVRASELLRRMRLDVDPRRPVAMLSLASRQIVEIARALAREPAVLLLDEPTSALSAEQVQVLFGILRGMRDAGRCIVFVSHRLQEVFSLADRLLVLRDGRDVGSAAVAETSQAEVVRQMVGRPLQRFYYKAEVSIGAPVLEVRALTRGYVREISLTVRAGEIVGLAGLAGSGRSALARTLFGVRRHYAGEIRVGGELVKLRSPEDAMRAGIALVPEDRKGLGLNLAATVRENMMLAGLRGRSLVSWLSDRRERQAAERYVRDLAIRTPSVDAPVTSLSGGNQQKVVLAKWLMTDPRVIILDEPTNGIDVGAKAEIYHLIGRLAAEGRAILLISSELPELLALSDRILTMYGGRITADIPRSVATEEAIGRGMLAPA